MAATSYVNTRQPLTASAFGIVTRTHGSPFRALLSSAQPFGQISTLSAAPDANCGAERVAARAFGSNVLSATGTGTYQAGPMSRS